MTRATTILALAMAAMLGSACHTPVTRTGEARVAPPASTTFDTGRHSQLREQRPAPPLAWYQWRNDLHPAVDLGTAPAVYERSVTITTDRQRSFRGRIHDVYSETTRRTRIRETTR